jgi:adenylyl- and sulfurtransferase ThiI
LNIVLVFPSALANKLALVRAIKKSGRVQVTSEGACIVCKAGNPSGLASKLADLSGIDSVAIAKKVSSRFSDVTNAIVQAGSKAILPREKFYVKVIQTAKADYVDRDVEFASSGALVGKLVGINALPAKSEHEADRVILAVVGKRSAYVCIKGRT